MRGKVWLIAGSLALAVGIGAGTGGPALAKDQNRATPAVLTPADVSLAESVRATLNKDDALALENINVEAQNGGVVLTGFVRSEGERDRAIQDAKKVPGVISVKDNLTMAEGDY
ncbi:MAG: hypothetical protein QOI66_4650 [Myxococcales bacterium]|jgi:osmotically-inducible protein OsmY|nr:hypothetical protein [Myxococcales bacterium]